MTLSIHSTAIGAMVLEATLPAVMPMDYIIKAGVGTCCLLALNLWRTQSQTTPPIPTAPLPVLTGKTHTSVNPFIVQPSASAKIDTAEPSDYPQLAKNE